MKFFIMLGAVIFASVKCNSTRRLKQSAAEIVRNSLKSHKKGAKVKVTKKEASLNGEITIEYVIKRYTRDQDKDTIDKAISDGFKVWQQDYVKQHLRQNGCNILKLEQVPEDSEEADLTIKFSHDLFKKYDSSFESVYLPRNRTIYVNDMYDLTPDRIVPLVAHELGHFLKLRHSYGPNDIMNSYERNIRLSKRDLQQLTKSEMLECMANKGILI